MINPNKFEKKKKFVLKDLSCLVSPKKRKKINY